MRLAFWLIILAACAAAFGQIKSTYYSQISIFVGSRAVAVRAPEKPAILPMTINGNSRDYLVIRSANNAQEAQLKITVRSSSADFIIYDSATEKDVPVHCNKIAEGGHSCVLVAQLGAESKSVYLISGEKIYIRSIDSTVLRYSSPATVSNDTVIWLMVMSGLLGFALLRSRARVQNLILPLFTLGILAVNDTGGLLFLITICVVSWWWIKFGMARFPYLAPTLFFVGVFVVERVVSFGSDVLLADQSWALPRALGFSYLLIKLADLSSRFQSKEIKDLNFKEYISYLFFPATFSSGPILSLINYRKNSDYFTDPDSRIFGLIRIIVGIVKKSISILILYGVTHFSDVVIFGSKNEFLLLLLIGSMLSVYLDFSAYSDMAIGLARLLGWRVPENFNFPILASNMRAFWSAWHMSLTSWITRQVYMPAAISVRAGPKWVQKCIPTLATMLAIGLWHGISAVWVLWAAHHTVGILLADLSSALTGSWHRFRLVRKFSGVAFVWYWFALSQSFVLAEDVSEAMRIYFEAMTFGLSN